MLIHSVTPIDALIEQVPPPPCIQISRGNGYVSGYIDNGVLCIQRLESTNPSDYLQQSLSPGTRIPVPLKKSMD